MHYFNPDILHATAGTTATKDDAKKFANLIGPMDTKLDRVVREKLISARVGLLLKASFFGNLATRLKLINADEWCATAATDGRNFYYNTRFIEMLRPKEIEFLFGHEVLHCVYDHFGRRGDRDPQLWNIANDFCVNGDLVKHNVGEKITSVPCLYDRKYDGMSSEEVYDQLYEKADKIDIGSMLDQMIDEHLDGDGDGDGDGDEEGKGRPKLTAEEKQAIKDEIKEAMLAAAATVDGAGNLPAGWHMDAVMPGQKPDEMIDIAVMLDASGSISQDMLRDFLSEIQGIMDSFPAYKIHVVTFDTDCYNPAQYDSDNLDSMIDYEVSGGGGTDFDCIFTYLKDQEITPRRLIVFTDGYPFGSWGDAEYCDTTWILHGTTTIVPPWGTHAYYDENKKD
jgi:predicted metal-dependent peptidase